MIKLKEFVFYTVGRLSEAKGQDMIVNMARLLKEYGFKFEHQHLMWPRRDYCFFKNDLESTELGELIKIKSLR